MNRFMGLMPANEIEKSQTFLDEHGLKVTIEAGPNGWTIIYADSSSKYEDVINTTEENFYKAFKIASSELGKLNEIVDVQYSESSEEQ